MRHVIFSLVIGALLGALAVWFFMSGPQAGSAANPEPAATSVVPTEKHEVSLDQPERVVVSKAAETRAPESESPISSALRRYAEDGLRRGWKGARQDEMPAEDLALGMQEFEKLVLESPANIGRSIGERRTKTEQALADAKSGGVFSLLERLDAGGVGPLPGLVSDPAQFEPLFARVADEQLRTGLVDREHPDKSIEDGVTLTWPAGVYRLHNLMKEKDPFPRDVTIAGAGMDATMLVLNSDLMTREGLRNFCIRDCTVNTDNNYLFDLRLKPAAIRFERVRFVGFDMGAGGSCLLGTKALALSAKSCRFEGGYGRSPQHGTLFDVRTDALVARLESCSFSLLSLRVAYIHPGATVLFVNCALDQILDDPLTEAAGRSGVMFNNCSLTRHEGGWETVPHLDLNALFPNWKSRLE